MTTQSIVSPGAIAALPCEPNDPLYFIPIPRKVKRPDGWTPVLSLRHPFLGQR